MSFRFVDDIATADCAVEIVADTLPGVFVDAARSLVARMVDPVTVRSGLQWRIELAEDDLRSLLYSWLAELVYIKDSENVLFSDFSIEKLETGDPLRLAAVVRGEKIDHARHEIAVDVKAVTMHMFEIERVGDSWRAFVIYDL